MSKNMKISNPMKVITGTDTRWSYANVWEPKSINGGAEKYSVSLIIPKSDTKTLTAIQKAIDDNILKIYAGKTKLLISELKDADAAVLGASALGWEVRE